LVCISARDSLAGTNAAAGANDGEVHRVRVPRLYDEDVLRANTVPVASAIYTEDLYVERRFGEETAALVPGVRAWVTSEFDHNGLRAHGERILDRLLDLVRGRA